MVTDGKVNRWNSVAYTAADERLLDSPLHMPGPLAAPFSARSGRRVNNSGLGVSVSSTGNGSATVSAGAGVIFDSTYPAQGAWRFEISAAVGPIALGARPSVGQSRIDLVVARIYDQDIAIGAAREVKIEVVAGNPGAAPSAPPLPALSVLLGTLTVPNAGAISLTSSTAVVVAAGGILPVTTTAERDALVTATIAYRGLVVDNAQTGFLERYNGTAWKQLQEPDDTGWTVATLGNSWVSYDAGVVFGIPAYRLRNGVVYFKGAMKSGTSGTTVFTLPVGMRPLKRMHFSVLSGNSVCRLYIEPTGVVQVAGYDNSTGSTAGNGIVSFDALSFLAEQ